MPSPQIDLPAGVRSVSDSIANYPYSNSNSNPNRLSSSSSTSAPTGTARSGGSSKQTSGPLPSIRSLRSRFQAFGVGSKKRLPGPKVVTGAEGEDDEPPSSRNAAALGYGHPGPRRPSPPDSSPELALAAPSKLRRPSGDSAALARRIAGAPASPVLVVSPRIAATRSMIPGPSSPNPHSHPHSPNPRQQRVAIIANALERVDSPASPGTKAGYRISSDFARPADQPPLAQLRQGNKLIRRKSGSSTPAAREATPDAPLFPPQPLLPLPVSPDVKTLPPSPYDARAASPAVLENEPSPARSFQPILIPAPYSSSSTSTSSTIISSSDSSLGRNQRPFSPLPNPVSPSISALQGDSPNFEGHRNDLAFRRHSIASVPSPLLANERKFSTDHHGASSRTDTMRGQFIDAATGADMGELREHEHTGLGIGSPGSIDMVNAFLSGQGSPRFLSALTTPPPGEPAELTSPEFNAPHTAPLRPLQPASSRVRPKSAGGNTHATTVTSPNLSRAKYASGGSFMTAPATSLLAVAPAVLELKADDASYIRRLQHQRNSTGDSTLSRASSEQRSDSRHSGNTFGESSPSFDEPSSAFDAPSTRHSSIQASDELTLDSDLVAHPSADLRRSRSALDRVRLAGGAEVSGMGSVEPISPVYVLSADDFGGSLYRSASASLGSSLPGSSRGSRGELAASDKEAKRDSRTRKTRSDNFSDAASAGRRSLAAKASHDLVIDTGSSAKSDQLSLTARDELRKSLASPLDDLIAGLGGRPLSHGSVDTHRTSSFFQADNPFEHSTSPRPPPPASALNPIAALPFPLVAPIPSVEVSPMGPLDDDDEEPEPLLSVDEMEREIARMEAELALSGTPLRADSFSSAPLSVDSSPVLDRNASLAFPDPPSRVSLARSLSQTSAASSSDVTPRTARRWSIVEVELAYRRMKQMLGSTKASDAGTLAGDSEMGDQSVDVDGAFERALRGLSKGSADEIERSAPDHEAEETLDESVTLLPASLRNGPPPPLDDDSTPKLEQHELDELPSSHSPTSSESAAGSALFSHASRKTSRESLHLPTRHSKESLVKANRRHTLAAPVSREALDDVFHAENARSVNEQRVGREELEARAARNYRRRSQNPRSSDSLRPIDQRSDDGSLASPGRRSPSRLVTVGLRSGAGLDWSRQYLSPSSPARAPSPAESFPNTPTQPLDDLPLTPTKRLLLNRRWTQDSVLDVPIKADSRAARSGTNDLWFPATPERAGHRKGKAPRMSVTEPNGGVDHALSMSQIRSMDKLEIFFKYASMKADLEKVHLERDALLDALRESRDTLTDVRSQRDDLDAELRRERSAGRQVKKLLGSEPETHADRLEELVRARQVWEKRAREALEDMERAREDADDLRTTVVEGREREERLERELALLGAKLAVSEADQRAPRAERYSASPRARVLSVPSPTSTYEHLTPASKLAAAYRERTPSSASSSLLNGFDNVGIAETPLMGQTLTFGPKSSYGSNASPTKDKTNNPSTARVQSPMQKPLILGSLSRKLAKRISKESTASSEYGEHLPPPLERPWDPTGSAMSGTTMPELNERDEAFLSDLSGTIEIIPPVASSISPVIGKA